MDAHLQAQIAFHLTGSTAGSCLGRIDDPRLRPALLSGYEDLTALRYDFPLLLVEDCQDCSYAVPLSSLVDDLLAKTAGGADGDRVRQHVLRLERGIRTRVADGAQTTLLALWDAAAEALIAEDASVADSLSKVRRHLTIDGRLVDCDRDLAIRVVSHAWHIAQDQRGRAFEETVSRLIVRLGDILKADDQKSSQARSAESLKSTFGTGPMDAFDFEAMSSILSSAGPQVQLPAQRRQRIEDLLSVLRSQRFFGTGSSEHEVYGFAFDNCADALDAYRRRLPEAIQVAKAIAIGELEVKGEYDDARHDTLFASFGNNGLEARYRSMFPDYLVHLDAGRMLAQEQEQLFEVLSGDLPFKVLVQVDDVIDASTVGDGHLAFSQRSRTLASTVVGLTGVFVLQAPASSLAQLREQVLAGLDFSGPALFSVFSGAPAGVSEVPAYLLAAAALESRVFPAFVYAPSSGQDWASRFSIDGNPQADQDWPLHGFAYQDAQSQAVRDQVPFTLVDFVACDPRYSRHFARVPREEWSDALVPVTDVVDQPHRDRVDRVPSLLMVDPEDTLHRVIVDETMVREARRCRSLWHSLQELGGIHNSHAERLLARQEAVWQSRLEQAASASVVEATADETTPPADDTTPPVDATEAPERSPDEAYIETSRCSTCNECTQINGKMFAYNENQQAYIADITAGTFAQLVEAAESCQVSVIHPGKPRDPNDPGLEDLIRRAAAFA